jgi:nucleoside-diphosphate-sugar epimerase
MLREPATRPRVLITGASGFIARWSIAPLSALGFEVHAVSPTAHHEMRGVNWHPIDLLAPHTIPSLIADIGPSHVLHAAWTTAHGTYWNDPNNTAWLDATVVLGESFARVGGLRFVLVGTCAEYDWKSPDLDQGSIGEHQAQGAPLSLYGRAKKRAADRLASIARSGNFEFANGRVFYPIGPGEHPNRFFPTVIRSLLAGEEPKLGPATQVRDVIDVRDAGRALGMLVTSRLAGAVNIASGVGRRLSDLAIQVGKRLERADLVRFGRGALSPDDPPRLVADVTRLATQLGFKPQYEIDKTVDDAISYWKNRDGHVQSTGRDYA